MNSQGTPSSSSPLLPVRPGRGTGQPKELARSFGLPLANWHALVAKVVMSWHNRPKNRPTETSAAFNESLLNAIMSMTATTPA